MNFYSFHLGDYAAHTKHLTLIEDLVYRRMLDLYYTNEKPLPLEHEKVARLIGMRDHMQEVSDVLSDFFLKSEEGYTNKRCDEEISLYKAKAERAKSANKSRWKADKSDLALKSHLISETNQIPTNNQEPITIKEKKQTKPRAVGADVFPEIQDRKLVDDWLKVRKAKRLPVTETGLEGFVNEVAKSGLSLEAVLRRCCEQGWAGFKASWLENDYGPPKRTEKFDPVAFVNRFAKKPSEYDEKVIEH
ncbi:Uncharacterized conserved protein YdaU, DUF1376 family [Nitrosospira sp. Nl5]|uniref:YdaU family protein n=1 Tax=Nitrosospira sp. Nl5 TaxID=200120 RepID=UPI00088A4CBD|nr:YdaU family protein [Nitrosospira sp. Nl5]SCX93229.1 Uncharacterized conserved protein YdaU, DUF1376 family [Nitrosospira sp. Nl5]